jgi:hypothetical protein
VPNYVPSLFQHIGVKSSLKGKIQNLKDSKFVNKFPNHVVNNPAAEISTNMVIYMGHQLKPLYEGKGVFWTYNSKPLDYIKFDFEKPFCLKKYFISSGSDTNLDDLIPMNSTLEAKPQLVNESFLNFNKTSDGYLVLYTLLDESGRLDNLNQPDLNINVTNLRIVFRRFSEHWILINRIEFF